ncbi:Integrase [Vibrio crassostreae]|nr:Integrase [Vibrio crassostreae]CAK3853101.1 Integrase [Vibrio crassostreae]
MSQGRKRTKIIIEQKSEPVVALHFEDMVLSNGSGKNEYLLRLRYVNVPKLSQVKAGNVTLAGRDDIVRTIYETLRRLPDNQSKQTYFLGIIDYFRYLDSNQYHGEVFDIEIMKDCIKYFNQLQSKGRSKSKARGIKVSLSFFLRQWNRDFDVNALPIVIKNVNTTEQAFHVETELKPLSKVLVRGALAFKQAIESNVILTTHPFFDEEKFNELTLRNGWTPIEASGKKRGFKCCMRPVPRTIKDSPLSLERLHRQIFYNQASRNWFFLFSMLTGMNKSVLANMRIEDVKFKSIGNGRFVFDGEKYRAGYKSLDNACGFSQRTKELIEGWLNVLTVIYQSLGISFSKELPLCPFFNSSGDVLTFSQNTSSLDAINIQLEKMTGLRVTTRRFRATKSDVLMRVTEDIFLVSQGLNNTLSVVAKRYSSGTQADHDNNLNATFSTLSAVAKGESLGKAIERAKIMHSDILSDYDYKSLRNGNSQAKPLMATPSGIKCSGPTPQKLITEARRMKLLGIDFSSDTGRCTDFMGCFDCDSHKLVATESDIWLMLSFIEQIEALKDMVASNSIPKKEFFIVEGLLKKVILRLKQKAPKNYKLAKDKIKNGEYHPLYQNRASANQFF